MGEGDAEGEAVGCEVKGLVGFMVGDAVGIDVGVVAGFSVDIALDPGCGLFVVGTGVSVEVVDERGESDVPYSRGMNWSVQFTSGTKTLWPPPIK